MAALTAPRDTAAQHQRMLHFIGQGTWSDAAVMERVRAHALPKIVAHGAISSWIIDDTGFPKKRKHSVGVARQYCGQLGKQDNCQVSVSLSIANDHASLPVAYQLYLPKVWADDQLRRDEVGVPQDVAFKTKPQIALDQLKWACESGLPRGVVLADAGYGVEAAFRTGMTGMGLRYVAGVKSTTTVWARGSSLPRAPGTAARAPARKPGRGRPAVRPVHDEENKPIGVEQLALSLPESSWQTIGRLPGAGLMTQDLDAAQFHAVSVEVGDSMPPMLETLQAVNPTFREMSSFADDGRVWRYSAANPKFDVEFLTPLRGGVEHGRKPLRMPALGGASAQALRFLDFLLRDPVRLALLHGGGVSVTVPSPERYATHKLIVASRRKVNPDKVRKDIAQASALIEVLRSARPVELREAVTELIGRGPAWRKAFEAGKARLPAELASAL